LSVRATISDSKSDFHKEFPYVIPPIYRKLADELLVELHLLSHQQNFTTDPIFSAGLKEIFTTFTNGYKPDEHINELFNAICNCNGFDPEEINSNSVEIISNTKSLTKETLIDYLSTIKTNSIKNNYYSRINAIGIYKMVANLPENKNLDSKELDKQMIKLSEIMGYPSSRVEKDISLYRSNIEKMKQALEILAQNIASKNNS